MAILIHPGVYSTSISLLVNLSYTNSILYHKEWSKSRSYSKRKTFAIDDIIHIKAKGSYTKYYKLKKLPKWVTVSQFHRACNSVNIDHCHMIMRDQWRLDIILVYFFANISELSQSNVSKHFWAIVQLSLIYLYYRLGQKLR